METKADLMAIRIPFISFDEVFVYHYVSDCEGRKCLLSMVVSL